jgi:signal transduction histidine kinase
MPSDADVRAGRERGLGSLDRRARQEQTELPQEVAWLGARVAELERDYARLERFAAIAAHELSEPLVMTEGYATLLLDRLGSQADPESRHDLEALSRSAARLRLLVETLLHEARYSARGLAREPVALSDVVDDCARLLKHELRARDARLIIRSLPIVLGDAALLGTVIKNLLSNALRYGPRSGATIRVAAYRMVAGWRISVVSEGPTIPREDRERIFAPFERGRDERRTKGTGLGLPISRGIVERQGGVMGVEPCPRGNRFYFTIPD